MFGPLGRTKCSFLFYLTLYPLLKNLIASHMYQSLFGGSIPENNECCWPCHLLNIEICELQIEQCSTAIEILSLIMWRLLCITLEILRDDVVNDNGNAGVVSHLFPLVFMETKHWLTPLESKAWLPLLHNPRELLIAEYFPMATLFQECWPVVTEAVARTSHPMQENQQNLYHQP